MNWRGLQAAVFRQIEIRLPGDIVEDVVSRHDAQSWFVYAHKNRRERKHVWWPSLWLAARLERSSRILETGCGCGLNLLWFAEHGFTNLHGSDIDGSAIAAGRELFEKMGLNLSLWVDDGLSPRFLPPERFDTILALNWTYHVENFDLVWFLELYRQHLTDDGYLVIDLIDSCYNFVPNNQFLTTDWEKPEEVRQPTEYKTRYAKDEVRSSARQTGFYIVRSKMCDNCRAPRRVYILALKKSAEYRR